MHEVLVALALLLVIEGILPFLSPKWFRHFLLRMASEKDGSLRMVGLFSMLLGVGMLYLVN